MRLLSKYNFVIAKLSVLSKLKVFPLNKYKGIQAIRFVGLSVQICVLDHLNISFHCL